MPSLTEVLNSEAQKSAVESDCVALIDAEVADKGGLSGLAIKAGYGAVKGIRPGFIQQVVRDLLPEFATALDPLWNEAKSQGRPVGEHLTANAGRVADALLTITDAKAERAKSAVVKGTYDKLRSSAKKNVEAAVPRLAQLVAKYAP